MPNLNYKKGSAFERKIQKHFESRGWFVIRSAGSHTPVDLVVLFKNQHLTTEPLLIQCKSSKKMIDILQLFKDKNIKELETLKGTKLIITKCNNNPLEIFHFNEYKTQWILLSEKAELYHWLTDTKNK